MRLLTTTLLLLTFAAPAFAQDGEFERLARELAALLEDCEDTDDAVCSDGDNVLIAPVMASSGSPRVAFQANNAKHVQTVLNQMVSQVNRLERNLKVLGETVADMGSRMRSDKLRQEASIIKVRSELLQYIEMKSITPTRTSRVTPVQSVPTRRSTTTTRSRSTDGPTWNGRDVHTRSGGAGDGRKPQP